MMRMTTAARHTSAAAIGAALLPGSFAPAAGAATADPTPPGTGIGCTPGGPCVNVPPEIDWTLWTAKDGAPRYTLDGIGFSEGKVRVKVLNGNGKVLWIKTVRTGHDPGLPEPTFHVHTTVRCNHKIRYATAKDLKTGTVTELFKLDPCII
jgi:hypothetical protein